MQHVAPNAFRPVSAAAAKASAVAAYDAACASPDGADWRSVADMLRAALPASPMKAGGASVTGTAPRWWADWKLGKVYSLDSLEVLFTDGVRVRCNLAQAPGKLPRIAAACRVAVAFYRARTGRSGVPAFAHIENVSDGSTFDAAACSRLTDDLRAADYGAPARRKPVTADAIARMEREMERRRAGLAVAEEALAEIMSKPLATQQDYGPAARRRVAMWQAAVTGGEEELAQMRAAAEPVEAEAPQPQPQPQPVEPATITFAATNEAPEVMPEVIEPAPAAHFEAMAICPAVGMPCKVDCPHRRGCGPIRPVAAARAPSLPVIASRALAARLSASAAYHARCL